MKDLALAACGSMTVQFEGVLDPSAAAKTLARVAELGCDDVAIDLGRAREISDVALAFLAGGLTRIPRSRVILRGLREHHARLLQELGAGSLLGRTGHSQRTNH
jgi:hypothetical protein